MATIAVVMVDGVADWEIGPVLPAAREWFGDDVLVASVDGHPVTSIGGLHIVPPLALADLDPLQADLWLLPGSDRWQAGEIPGLSPLLRERVAAQRAVAAICGGTLAFAYAGLLDTHRHTSNSLAFLREHVGPVYRGETNYRGEKAIRDAGVITAGGSSPVHFATACLHLLHPDQDRAIAQAYAMFAGEFAEA